MKRSDPNTLAQHARDSRPRASGAPSSSANANPIFQQMFSGRRAVGTGAAARGVPHRADVALVGQLVLLMSRYWKVKMRDRARHRDHVPAGADHRPACSRSSSAGRRRPCPFWCLGALQELGKKVQSSQGSTRPPRRACWPRRTTPAAIFFVVVSAVWFGTRNAAREIVTERAIYLRERMVNLSLFNYVFSKYIMLTPRSASSSARCCSAIVFFALGFHGGLGAFLLELAGHGRRRR